jgi:hypothetical protein
VTVACVVSEAVVVGARVSDPGRTVNGTVTSSAAAPPAKAKPAMTVTKSRRTD